MAVVSTVYGPPMLVAALTDTALALLIGGATALGASVGGLVAVVAEQRRQHAIDFREARREQAATKVAARLIKHELDIATLVLDHALSAGEWIDADHLAMRAWDAEKNQLAAALPLDTWDKVRTLAAYLQTLQDRPHGSEVGMIGADDRESLEGARRRCGEAVMLLGAVAVDGMTEDR